MKKEKIFGMEEWNCVVKTPVERKKCLKLGMSFQKKNVLNLMKKKKVKRCIYIRSKSR